MKLLLALLSLALWAYVHSQGQDLTPVDDTGAAQNDGRFVLDVEQSQAHVGSDKEESDAEDDKSDADDDKGDESNAKAERRRRSVSGFGSLLSPSRKSGYPLSGYYYRVPSKTAGYGYYYDNPAVEVSRSAEYYNRDSRVDRPWSFINFFNSFRPQQAFRTSDDVYVRNYYRYGSFDDCISDFQKLRLTEVKALSDATVADDSFWRRGSVAAVSGVGEVTRETTTGYVGYSSDFPYRVYALRSGCELNGFPGLHDCIVFRGATYPYTSTVRRFVYLRQDNVPTRNYRYNNGYLNW